MKTYVTSQAEYSLDVQRLGPISEQLVRCVQHGYKARDGFYIALRDKSGFSLDIPPLVTAYLGREALLSIREGTLAADGTKDLHREREIARVERSNGSLTLKVFEVNDLNFDLRSLNDIGRRFAKVDS